MFCSQMFPPTAQSLGIDRQSLIRSVSYIFFLLCVGGEWALRGISGFLIGQLLASLRWRRGGGVLPVPVNHAVIDRPTWGNRGGGGGEV